MVVTPAGLDPSLGWMRLAAASSAACARECCTAQQILRLGESVEIEPFCSLRMILEPCGFSLLSWAGNFQIVSIGRCFSLEAGFRKFRKWEFLVKFLVCREFSEGRIAQSPGHRGIDSEAMRAYKFRKIREYIRQLLQNQLRDTGSGQILSWSEQEFRKRHATGAWSCRRRKTSQKGGET